MTIYIVHRLHGPEKKFDYMGEPVVGDFASEEVLHDWQLTNGDQSVQRYDAQRSIIGTIKPHPIVGQLGSVAKVLFPNDEFEWGKLPLFDLFCKTVRWVERLGDTLILHHSPRPTHVDGTMLCIRCTPEQLGHPIFRPLGRSESNGRIEYANNAVTLASCLGDVRIERLEELPGSNSQYATPRPLYCAFTDGHLAKFVV